jgi:hypothetical protein
MTIHQACPLSGRFCSAALHADLGLASRGCAACGASERSLQAKIVDRGRVRRFLAAHPRARQVLSVTMGNAKPRRLSQ